MPICPILRRSTSQRCDGGRPPPSGPPGGLWRQHPGHMQNTRPRTPVDTGTDLLLCWPEAKTQPGGPGGRDAGMRGYLSLAVDLCLRLDFCSSAQCYNSNEKLAETQNAETMRDTDGFSAVAFEHVLGHQFGTFCENLKVIDQKILE